MGKKNKVLFTIEPPKIKERKFWYINPVTKIIPSKTLYDRKKRKKAIAEENEQPSY